MKTLVTGGNGFVGSAIVRKLTQRGEEDRWQWLCRLCYRKKTYTKR
ncbi:MAG: NAD-dependent epimerase/dehydratase family protein [Deltaproteobacteria bacterium]|nr:NAD-dependent epimerase/dehydratase family protein [Deltaproteobacteria bacterium]